MKLNGIFKVLACAGALLLSALPGAAQFRVYSGSANSAGTGKFNMTLKNITNNFSADLAVVSLKNVRKVSAASSKNDTAQILTGNSNLQGMQYWSGIKNPMTNQIKWMGRMSTEFYIVTQWSSGFGKLIGAVGGKKVGSISLNGQTRDVFKSTSIRSTDSNGVKYTHSAIWVLCAGVNPVNASSVVKQVSAKGWLSGNEFIQFWYRYIECYNNTGKTLGGEARLWFR